LFYGHEKFRTGFKSIPTHYYGCIQKITTPPKPFETPNSSNMLTHRDDTLIPTHKICYNLSKIYRKMLILVAKMKILYITHVVFFLPNNSFTINYSINCTNSCNWFVIFIIPYLIHTIIYFYCSKYLSRYHLNLYTNVFNYLESLNTNNTME